jgi:hypothetical protein
MTRLEYLINHTKGLGGLPVKSKCLLSGKTFYNEYTDMHIRFLNETEKYELIK